MCLFWPQEVSGITDRNRRKRSTILFRKRTLEEKPGDCQVMQSLRRTSQREAEKRAKTMQKDGPIDADKSRRIRTSPSILQRKHTEPGSISTGTNREGKKTLQRDSQSESGPQQHDNINHAINEAPTIPSANHTVLKRSRCLQPELLQTTRAVHEADEMNELLNEI